MSPILKFGAPVGCWSAHCMSLNSFRCSSLLPPLSMYAFRFSINSGDGGFISGRVIGLVVLGFLFLGLFVSLPRWACRGCVFLRTG